MLFVFKQEWLVLRVTWGVAHASQMFMQKCSPIANINLITSHWCERTKKSLTAETSPVGLTSHGSPADTTHTQFRSG